MAGDSVKYRSNMVPCFTSRAGRPVNGLARLDGTDPCFLYNMYCRTRIHNLSIAFHNHTHKKSPSDKRDFLVKKRKNLRVSRLQQDAVSQAISDEALNRKAQFLRRGLKLRKAKPRFFKVFSNPIVPFSIYDCKI